MPFRASAASSRGPPMGAARQKGKWGNGFMGGASASDLGEPQAKRVRLVDTYLICPPSLQYTPPFAGCGVSMGFE